jgi:hypothetical protein
VPVDLLFSRAPLGPLPPIELVFGESDDDEGSGPSIPPANLLLSAALPAFGASIALRYLSGAPRGPAAVTAARHQWAAALPAGAALWHQAMARLPAGLQARHQRARAVAGWVVLRLPDTLHALHLDSAARHQNAARVGTWPALLISQDAHRVGQWRQARQQDARALHPAPLRIRWQERIRGLGPELRAPWQTARPMRLDVMSRFQRGLWRPVSWLTRFQRAIWPPPWSRVAVLPPEPPWDPCYVPDPNLLFAQPWTGGADLLFVCERHDGGGGGPEPPPPPLVVVPIRSVYIVLNTVTLRRVADDAQVPVLDMSLSIDADSWTWGFSASIPGQALALVAPDSNGPIELEATINGSAWRVLAEQIGRERTFNASTLRVSGRGKSALLDAPYSPTRTTSNDIARTAQQLMDDVLMLNNVPIGWDIDWRIDDWLVPAGAFAMSGPYIEGLTQIAGAAGAYIQPHPTAQTLIVLPRYPAPPWDWASVTPDIELPAAVTVQEGIEWTERPAYNRVYVSGASQGILGQVTRAGTAGDLVAEMVTDALITAPEAARQRGIAILGDTGRQAAVTLRVPVLSETGVIKPGQFVRYVDGTDNNLHRLGLVRAASVAGGFPEVWQTLQLETHP